MKISSLLFRGSNQWAQDIVWTALSTSVLKVGLSNPTSYPTNHQQSHCYSCPESDFSTEAFVLHCVSVILVRV